MNKKLLVLPLLSLLIGCSAAEHFRESRLLGHVYPSLKQRLEQVRAEIGEHRLSKQQIDELVCSAQNLNFPGEATFAALGQSAKSDSALLDKLATVKPSNVNVEKALTLLKGRAFKKVGVTESQAEDALHILREKQFLGDSRDATIAVLGLASRTPGSVTKNVPSLVALPRELGIASIQDIRALYKNPKGTANHLLKRGHAQQKPAILNKTLKVLASKATYQEVALTSQKLLENETVRLAVIIYAQSHGVEIDHPDLDAVSRFLGSEEPNLDELSQLAAQTLVTRYGGGPATTILKKMRNRNKSMECT